MSGTQRNMAKVVAVFCIAALTAVAGIAQAHEGGWQGEHGGKQQQHDFRKLGNKLGLTAEQQSQAKAIFQSNREVIKPVLTTLHAEQKNLRALIHADTIDEAAIRAETAKLALIQADLNVNRAKVGAQFRAILTPPQLAILKTLPQNGHKKGKMPPPAE
jgi:Spy/CpxP family protein refolding chaperone